MSHRQPGDQARKRTLDRCVSRIGPRPGLTRGLRIRGVLREGTRARLQEDLALHGPGRASAEVGQLLHPRAEVPQHLGHHRAGQGRRDPRLPQHLPAPRQQDAVGGRPVPGGAGPRAVAVLPLPRLALQAGRLVALGHPQGSAARLRRRQLPGACDPMRGVGRLHLHQSQPRQHRAGARPSSASWRTASRAIRLRGRTRSTGSRPNCSATGRSSSTASPRATTGPYLHASSFGTLTAEAKEALDKPNPFTDALAYQLKGPHRMFSFSGEPSQKTPYSKPIECVMEASAAGPMEQARRSRSDAAGAQSHPVGEVRLRLVPVLPELRADLRRVRLSHVTPTGRRDRTHTSSKSRCSISPRRLTRSGSARS